ncbi:MAG: hypothetical protein V1907_00065 [Candidatus Kerfeldbacteria bacterium]
MLQSAVAHSTYESPPAIYSGMDLSSFSGGDTMASRFITDFGIVLGPMDVKGVFTLAPQLDWRRGRMGALRFTITCDEEFKHEVNAAVRNAMKGMPGKMIPSRVIRDPRKVPTEIVLKFDAPPRQQSFAKLYVGLAAELFMLIYRHLQESVIRRRLFEAIEGKNQPLAVVKGRKPATTGS